MAKLTLTDISSGYLSTTTFNANNTLIEAALENTLSRDGTSPNTMSANLDMNSNKIVNLTDPTGNQDAATKAYVDGVSGGIDTLAELTDVTSAAYTNRYVLVADGAAYVGRLLTEADISDLGTTVLQNIVEDTTPQLGGNLDPNGNKVEIDAGGNSEAFAVYDSTSAWDMLEVGGAVGNVSVRPLNQFHNISPSYSNQYLSEYWNSNNFYFDFNGGTGGVPNVYFTGAGIQSGSTGFKFASNIHMTNTRQRFGNQTMTEWVDFYYDGTDLLVDGANGDVGGSDAKFTNFTQVQLGSYVFNADQTVGAGQDNYVLTYDNATGEIGLEAATGGGIANVVEDTTPQLGGALATNGFNIQVAADDAVIWSDGTDTLTAEATTASGVLTFQPTGGFNSVDFNLAVTANSYDGISAANLVDKSATEDITGAWAFSTSLNAVPLARSVSATGNTATTDYGIIINLTGGTGQTFTLDADPPTNAVVMFDNSAGASWSIAASVSLIWAKDGTTGTRTLADDGIAVAKHRGSGTWIINGSAKLT